jgi:hypothetical protein
MWLNWKAENVPNPQDLPQILKCDLRTFREVFKGSVDASMMWIAKEINKPLG